MMLYGDVVREYIRPESSGATIHMAVANWGAEIVQIAPCLYRDALPINCWTLTLAPNQVETLDYRAANQQGGVYEFLGHRVRFDVVALPELSSPQQRDGFRFEVNDLTRMTGMHGREYLVINATITVVEPISAVRLSVSHGYGTGSPDICHEGTNEAVFGPDSPVGYSQSITACQDAGTAKWSIGGRVEFECSDFRAANENWVGECPRHTVGAQWQLPDA